MATTERLKVGMSLSGHGDNRKAQDSPCFWSRRNTHVNIKCPHNTVIQFEGIFLGYQQGGRGMCPKTTAPCESWWNLETIPELYRPLLAPCKSRRTCDESAGTNHRKRPKIGCPATQRTVNYIRMRYKCVRFELQTTELFNNDSSTSPSTSGTWSSSATNSPRAISTTSTTHSNAANTTTVSLIHDSRFTGSDLSPSPSRSTENADRDTDYIDLSVGLSVAMLAVTVASIVTAVCVLRRQKKVKRKLLVTYNHRLNQRNSTSYTNSQFGNENITDNASVEQDNITDYASVEQDNITYYTSVEQDNIKDYTSVEQDNITDYTSIEQDNITDYTSVEQDNITNYAHNTADNTSIHSDDLDMVENPHYREMSLAMANMNAITTCTTSCESDEDEPYDLYMKENDLYTGNEDSVSESIELYCDI